jgi:hypothetical protein
VVLLAGEAVGGAGLVLSAPGDRGGAVGVVEVACEDLAVPSDDQGGAAEAVGDVVAGLCVGAQGARAVVAAAQGREGEHAEGRREAQGPDEAAEAQAGEGAV